ncbi:hypothetical protein T440DRAFT_512932 [Plenodomus tracheiphilus IPT5]|uniref:Uncharacterized protein n=1 Tax=Plenodomus tracheiphilus IPT5 TaxID=1408161 RepID=A0A6A7BPV0_9PLEO|nr:hypothetical protein T440DRAFT_512932 [Plenodomus tracheiphilus IPT5]
MITVKFREGVLSAQAAPSQWSLFTTLSSPSKSEDSTLSRNQILLSTVSTFRATHLEIPINPRDPSPQPSTSLLFLLLQVKIAWVDLEAAEKRLLAVDGQVDTEMSIFVASRRHPEADECIRQRARITRRKYRPSISDAEDYFHAMHDGVKKLERAARAEPKTLEARAALEIDIPVFDDCLATLMEMITGTKAQVERAGRELGL